MADFFGSIWWFLVTLGLLITFHEYGHFWVARKLGVTVERFSIGFGKALWQRTAKDGVEYRVAAIPLGGYVKFLDERDSETALADPSQSYHRKSVYIRMAVTVAGPAFNIIFTLCAFWLMFMVGKQDFQPIVGRTDGIAASAGMTRGDRIVEVDGKPVRSWTDATFQIVNAAAAKQAVDVSVTDAQGNNRNRRLDYSQYDQVGNNIDLGIIPQHVLLDAVVGRVADDSPAAKAGLLAGDVITQADSQSIDSFDQISAPIQKAGSENRAVEITIRRGQETLFLILSPEKYVEGERSGYRVGIEVKPGKVEYDAVIQYGPIAAIGASAQETWSLTKATLKLIGNMVTGNASLRNLSGPISIAQYANVSAQIGVAWFLFFLGMVSLSLGILNLLPIPILDGGHLLYYLIEVIKGSPVSENTMIMGQYLGLGLLGGLMGLAFYNDFARLFS